MATKRNATEEKPRIPPLKIRNAELRFKNFAGVGKKFNAEGDRNFHVVINPNDADKLQKDGWNIKWHEPRNEDEDRWASLKVAARFDKYPPTVMIRTDGVTTPLNAGSVGILDWATLSNVNVMITASYWTTATGKGFKAYLSRLMADVDSDDFEFAGFVKPADHPSDER